MTNYSLIDPALSEWAQRHSLVWLTDYQGSQVRTFYLNEQSRDKVQIWIDVPRDEATAVHIVQYKIGGKKKYSEEIACAVSDLPSALDQAFTLANEWLSANTLSPQRVQRSRRRR